MIWARMASGIEDPGTNGLELASPTNFASIANAAIGDGPSAQIFGTPELPAI